VPLGAPNSAGVHPNVASSIAQDDWENQGLPLHTHGQALQLPSRFPPANEKIHQRLSDMSPLGLHHHHAA